MSKVRQGAPQSISTTDERVTLSLDDMRPVLAVHEAAHAVVAWVLGLQVKEVSIRATRSCAAPDGHLLGGHVSVLDDWDYYNKRYGHGYRTRRIRRLLDIAHFLHVAAGYWGELHIMGAAVGDANNYSGDEKLKREFFKSAGLSEYRHHAYLERQAYRLVCRHREKIIEVAQALLDHPKGRIGRTVLKKIMGYDAATRKAA